MGKFFCKGRYYFDCDFLSENCHYSRAVDFVSWRTGWRVFTTSDGKTYRLVIWRFYIQLSITNKTGGECAV